jgi:ligand-binding sensor protein
MSEIYRIKSREEFQQILDEVYETLGMPAAIMDTDGMILQSSGERNALCSAIRADLDALTAICAQTQKFMSKEAERSRKPLIELCEAGMVKFVIPLFNNGDCIGSLTACGFCIPGEEIEDFIIQKNTRISEEKIDRLKKEVQFVDKNELSALTQELFKALNSDL